MSLARRLSVLAVLLVATAAACGDREPAPGPSHAGPASSAASRGAVLVVVADVGFEDTEYQAVRDGLLAAGYTPVVADSSGDEALGVGGAKVTPGLTVADATASDYVGIVLIGGGGAKAYWDDAVLHGLLREAVDAGEPVGAICAAPVTLARAGLLEGRAATVWSDYRDELEQGGCTTVGTGVVVDGRLVTGDGPDSAREFAAALVEKIDAATAAAAD